MNEGHSIVFISSIIMFCGVLATAWLGYLGTKSMAKSNIVSMNTKADHSLVEELRTEIHELKQEIIELSAKLNVCEAARGALQKENIELMRQFIAISKK